MKKQKICIIGGGLTGLTTAICLSKLNCEIDLITGPLKENLNSNRTIAISESNVNFLKKLNIFRSDHKQELWPCSIMRLYAHTDKDRFSEIFAINNEHKRAKVLYMIKNSKISKLMMKKITEIKSISIRSNKKIFDITNSGLLKSIKLNNKNYKYNLIIICSGSNSNLVKKLFHNQFMENNYGETSITTILNHSSFKNNTVRQIFLDNEILAFLPIANTQTSIVWTTKKNIYPRNNLLTKNKIKQYAKKYLNKNTSVNELKYKNLNFLIRRKYFRDRILLFGDALHVVHPFVGQGFNMILRDLSCLEKILSEKINLGLDVGSYDILSEFSNEIKPANFIFSLGIDLMKSSFSLQNKHMAEVRNSILKILNRNNFAKDLFFNLADKGLKF